jgi:hypothetical protein
MTQHSASIFNRYGLSRYGPNARRITNRRDFQISSVIFLLCAVVTVALYRSITRSERSAVPVAELLKPGASDYAVIASSGCIGTMHTVVNDSADNVIVNSNATFRILLSGRVIPVKMEFEANFNALGQLGGSLLKVRADAMEVSIGSININPMTVRTRFAMDGYHYAYDSTLPLSVDLVRNRDTTYRILYTKQPGFAEEYTTLVSQPLMQDLLVRAEPLADDGANCPGASALDLTGTVGRLTALARELTKTMKPILPNGI